MKKLILATTFLALASVTITANARTVCGSMTTMGSCNGDFPRVGVYGKNILIQVSADECRSMEKASNQVYCVDVAKGQYSLGNVNFGYTKAASAFRLMEAQTHRHQVAEAKREKSLCPDDKYRVISVGRDRQCTCIKGRPICNY